MNTAVTLNEINNEAFELPYKELGLSKTIRFINQYSAGQGNYTNLKEKMLENKFVEDIVIGIQTSKSQGNIILY